MTFHSADWSDLHVDHEPDLQDWERLITANVCDLARVQLLCAACHAAKTARTYGVAPIPMEQGA